MAMTCALASCAGEKSSSGGASIGKQDIQIKNGLMTPEVLWSMGRVGGISVSPDGKNILYGVQYYSIPQNKSNRDLYVVPVSGGASVQLTKTACGEQEAIWSADGMEIYFLSSESGSSQLWKMRKDGKKRRQLTSDTTGIDAFSISPDQSKILFVSQVQYGKRVKDLYPDLPLSSGKVIDDLMYKHWDEWVEAIPHPFVADLTKKGLINVVDLLKGQPYESPMKPLGGIEQLAWSPDGKSIAYTCRKKMGKDYALSTNSDIYLYGLESKQTRNLTEGMMGYDTNPVFSPDGQFIAFQSMARDGYESDQDRLFIHDLNTGNNRCLSEALDGDVSSACWAKDGRSLCFLSALQAVTQIFRVDVATASIKQVTDGMHDFESIAFAGDQLVGLRHSLSHPNDIYRINPDNGEMVPLTDENKEIYARLKVGRVEKRMIETTDQKQMLTWVVYPPDFDSTKVYPAILYCSGGPQGTVGQFWSFRWNLQLMAANGYIVVAPNRRGVSGLGQAWKEQISKDYGGQNMKDYLSAIDALAKEPYVDEKHLGCVGASYGGFSVYWLAGNHHKRFKAFIAHSGIFNAEAQYLETEELWFENWDMGGPFWETSNVAAQKSFANSPHKFVKNWDTPILCIHGEKDYRILASQGMAAFNAAKLLGIPAELLVYPDENHWILQPQNGILWQRRFFNWLDQWLK
ncbi:MAG: S9 family peptidase [Bacteroidales bacterium]|nr:S9 family peptidase [Bacteroidales bacterium]